jgi:hypothetical protein
VLPVASRGHLIHSYTYPPIYLSIHPFIHPFIHPSIAINPYTSAKWWSKNCSFLHHSFIPSSCHPSPSPFHLPSLTHSFLPSLPPPPPSPPSPAHSLILSFLLFQHGMISTGSEDYFVEPLWNDTEHDRESHGHLHVLYRRSAIKSLHPSQEEGDEAHCGVKGE